MSTSRGTRTDTGTTWDGSLYDERHGYVWRHGASVVELLAPRAGERILDLGCGTGHLARSIADSGATVIGIDSAPDMVERARASYPDLRFEVADGAAFSFPEPFDAVFSNAALHWIRPPERVAESVRRALRPGGRFVGELGGKGNVEAVVRALIGALEAAGNRAGPERNPWYFPSAGEYASLLEAHGFEVRYAELFDRPTPLDGGERGLANWLGTFGESYLAAVPLERRDAAIAEVERRLRPELYRDGGWTAPYRRLRFVALAE